MNRTRFTTWAIALTLILAGSGCDLSVVNAGPVQDEFLDDPGAHAAVVAGVELRLIRALNMLNYFGSEASKEITQGGRIHPIKLPAEPRQLDPDLMSGDAWNQAQGARWVAEDGVRRLRENAASFESSDLAALSLLYAGYTNRMLGENMCEGVVDGGPIQSRTVFFETAEEYFTEAMSVALGAGRSDLATAAQAGRAAARLWLEDYAGASQDAAAVPVDFVFRARFENAGEPSNNNWIKYINSNNPYRELSVEKTFYETYYPETGDPRVAWTTDPKVPNAEFSYVKWLIPEKYPALDSPVRLSSGREMVLIQAETALRAGNWEDALMLLNSLRAELVSDVTGEPLDLWTATNATEAWSVLKRERGIELWLEARRLGDLWRWVDQDTPGEMEDVTNLIRLCMPIAKSEMQTNSNIAIDHQSPTNPLFTGIRPDY